MNHRSAMAIALSRPVVSTATKLALLVGTVLALINHGPALLQGSLESNRYLQIALTYLVPYGVSTYSSVRALQGAALPTQDTDP